MKYKYINWIIILVGTVLPIIIDTIADDYGSHDPFIWSITLIPSIIIIFKYPNWSVVIGTAIFYSLFELTIEFNQEGFTQFALDVITLVLGIIVNWSILLTVGYLRIKTEKLVRKVEEMTITDPLTGVYNRRYFDFYIEQAIPLSKRMSKSLILVMFDIDHFKRVNDTYGHVCGDYALKHITDVIKSNVREADVVIRMGGEEFAILLQETSLEEGSEIAERVREAVEESKFIYNKQQIPITISLGLTEYKSEKVEQFIEKTDQALYKAKSNGRNQLVVSSDSSNRFCFC
ncbi:GGDEF domain-containing protein [Neobacillus vireti]|uniref:GGDEF domain-containing protein n=1 Tax=Neobacillus vireti TaxID=220686 RepID=UPI002FFEFD8D